MSDKYSRQIKSSMNGDEYYTQQNAVRGRTEFDQGLMTLPSAEPEQYGRVFNGIVVEYPSINTYPEYEGKPYFQIKYTENGQEFIGYGTYKPEVLSEFLKEYFMPSAEPKTGRDCTDFVRWLMDEVMDEENWQMNAVANGEIICRKLKKLGLLDVVDGYYVETQKTGEWVRHELWDTPWYTCSECDSHGRNDYKFCPNCGARMLGEDGEE